jgi:endonuclease I
MHTLKALCAAGLVAACYTLASVSTSASLDSAPISRAEIHALIDDHTRVLYSGGAGVNTRDVMKEADQHPDDPRSIVTFYKNSKVTAADTGNWNREHIWPISYGGDRDDDFCNYQYSDLHALFASDASYNTSRGNKPFDDCHSGCSDRVAEGHPSAPNRFDKDSWEVWDGRKGEAARAIFYMDVRYEGGKHAGTDCDEPDLMLTDDLSLVVTTRGRADRAYMGRLTTLLRWHREDPVDERERRRNDVVERYQGNRNPFVDHPEWVRELWPSVFMPTVMRGAVWREIPLPTPRPPGKPSRFSPSISAMQCAGRDEWVEIQNFGIAGADLAGWTLVSVTGDQRFEFPSYFLAPKESVIVHTGPDAAETSGEHLRWTTRYIWNNAGDAAELLDRLGQPKSSRDCDAGR